MKKEKHYHQGKFSPKNPQKYKGNPSNIIARSGWEFKVMHMLDTHPDVLQWSSEEIIIGYVSPIDNRPHRYFPDFWFKRRNNQDGSTQEFLVEVKPDKQQVPPKPQKRLTKRYINEVHTWGVNSAKWEAAEAYCKKKGWIFMKVGERDLGLAL